MKKLQEFLKTHIIPYPKVSQISSYFCAIICKIIIAQFSCNFFR